MSKRTQKIGRWGENVAAGYLEDKGYAIVAQNVRTPYGEIDLVAEKDGMTVFIEVKTRTSSRFGPPEISVTPRKQAHMLASAEQYAAEHGISHWQIDVIAITQDRSRQEILHFENAISG